MKKEKKKGRNRALEWKAAPTRKLKSPPLDDLRSRNVEVSILFFFDLWRTRCVVRATTLRCVNVTECAQVFFKCSSMLPHGGKSKCHKNSSTEKRLLLLLPPSPFFAKRRVARDEPPFTIRAIATLDTSVCLILIDMRLPTTVSRLRTVSIEVPNVFQNSHIFSLPLHSSTVFPPFFPASFFDSRELLDLLLFTIALILFHGSLDFACNFLDLCISSYFEQSSILFRFICFSVDLLWI